MGTLGPLDYAVFGSAVMTIAVIGWVNRKGTDTRTFFLGGKHIPWPVASLAFIATEISAITILSVPGNVFGKNWFYLQFFIGSALAKLFVALFFVPVFFRSEYTTIYEYLGVRFGAGTRYAGSVFFFVTRLLGSGVRLCMASFGVAGIMGWPFLPTLVGFTIVSTGFIVIGGIRAVMWVGAFTAAVFYVAGGAVIAFVATHLDGGFAGAWNAAAAAGKNRVFNWVFDLSNGQTFWVAVVSTFFSNLAVFGADHDFVQRLLTVRTRRAGQTAAVSSIVAALPLVCTYLLVGSMLFGFFALTGEAHPARGDAILPDFTRRFLPDGLRGLVLAAVVLASIDSPLSSLSASFVTDIYKPLFRRNAPERHYMRVSRLSVLAFGVLLAAVAWGFSPAQESLLWIAIDILMVMGGSILGVFLLGMFTRVKANRSCVLAMTISTVQMWIVYLLIVKGLYPVASTWLIVLGTAETFALGYLFSLLGRARGRPGGSAADA